MEKFLISVIVPIFNEASALKSKKKYFEDLSRKTELIFVDGGSSDGSLKYIPQNATVHMSSPGRAKQLNKGAGYATSENLLFLHADTFVEDNALEEIINVLKSGICGGALRHVLDSDQILYRFISWTGHMRAKCLHIFYGDQGIFVKKELFDNIKGFPEVDIGEDILFSKKLKKVGQTIVLNSPIIASRRRWCRQGVVKTFLINQWITFGLLLGQNPSKLAKFYKNVR